MNKKLYTTFVFSAFFFFGALSFAQTVDRELQKAVSALQRGQFETGLLTLQKIGKTSNDPRIDYYKGFVFEKLGKCVAAKLHYQSALHSKNKALQTTAKKSLKRFASRCTIRGVSTEVPSYSSNTGLKILGWSGILLGSALLIGTPIKEKYDRELAAKGEPYFSYKYGCKLNFGDLDTQGCNQSALRKDKNYDEYMNAIESTKLLNSAGYIVGGVLLGAGVVTILSVSLSGNTQLAIRPTMNSVSLRLRF